MQKYPALVIALLALGVSPVWAAKATPAPAPEPPKAAQPATPPDEARANRRVAFAKKEASEKPEPVAAGPKDEKAEAAPDEKKPSFWQKMFGRRKATPAPVAATPEPTPAPTSRKGRTRPTTSENKSDETKKDVDSPKSEKTKPANAKPKADQPEPEAEAADEPPKKETEPPEPVKPPTPSATPVPEKKNSKTKATPEAKNIPPTTSADLEVQEKYKYDVAKAKALTDPNVLKLKDKAAFAATEDEARKAQKAYTKALFSKMRSIDGSINERIDRVEAGIIRRLEGSE